MRAVRQDPEEVRAGLVRRDPAWSARLDELLAADKAHRAALVDLETLRSERNRLSESVSEARRAGREADAAAAIARVREMAAELAQAERAEGELGKVAHDALIALPNVPHTGVPSGLESVDVRRVDAAPLGTPSATATPHWEIGQRLGILDFERAGRIAGSRFVFYRGVGARLERALISFMLDHGAARGYTELVPPYLVKEETLEGTRHLPKFREDMFETVDGRFLISTAEIPLTAYHGGEILAADELPRKYIAHSPCFRSEAGAAGRDTRGIIRQHQFDKVELVTLCRPERSYDELEAMTRDAESVLQALQLSYRVVVLGAEDMGFSAAKTYDLEVLMPGSGGYREISSVSNVGAFQARSLGIRYRDESRAVHHVHTLNGSALAVSRTLAAVLEQGLQEDGSVVLPAALWPYMAGVRVLRDGVS